MPRKVTGPVLWVFLLTVTVVKCDLERNGLRFTVEVVYSGDALGQSMMLAGSGLCLGWDEAPLAMEDQGGGLWTAEVAYKSNRSGYFCEEEGRGAPLEPTEDLKLRFFLGEADMLGPSYSIRLPKSMVSSYFTDPPKHTFRPWFHTMQGSLTTFTMTSTIGVIGERDLVMYLPPGFEENPRPVYDLIYMFDLGPTSNFAHKLALDMMFTTTAYDGAVIGMGDWRGDDKELDRSNLLTPVPGYDFRCREGDFGDNCAGCLPPGNLTQEELIWWMTEGGCGVTIEIGGFADDTIDFLTGEVFAEADRMLGEMSGGVSSLTSERRRTFAMGYSLGGLAACHAAWTRPRAFGGAACQSPSLWWPYNVDDPSAPYSEFHFVNETLKTNTENRLPQKILIDVGEEEEETLAHMVFGAIDAFEAIGTHDMFEADGNLWLHVYPGEDHSSKSWLDRIWNSLNILTDKND